MERTGDPKPPRQVDEAGFARDAACSICGEDPRRHTHQAKALVEWRPGEPCVVGFQGGERMSVECPYCGASHGPLDQGWLPEHLPLRVIATCCDGRTYHVVAENTPGHRTANTRAV